MKEQRGKTALVGGLVILAMVGLGYLVILFGETPTFFTGGVYNITIHFQALGVTQRGTEVLVQGKRIGQITEIKFQDDEHPEYGVNCVAQIDEKYGIPAGTKAVESLTALVLGKVVIQLKIPTTPKGERPPPLLNKEGTAIIQGEVQPMLENIFPPETMPAFTEMVTNIGDLAKSLTPVARELEQLLQSRKLEDVDQARLLPNISTLVQRMDQAVKDLHGVLGDPQSQQNVRKVLENFAAASSDFRLAMDELRTTSANLNQGVTEARGGVEEFRTAVTRLDTRIDEVMKKLIVLLDTTSHAMQGVELAVTRINEGQGTMGQLVTDKRLYESMVLSMQRLEEAIKEWRDVAAQWKRGELKIPLF